MVRVRRNRLGLIALGLGLGGLLLVIRSVFKCCLMSSLSTCRLSPSLAAGKGRGIAILLELESLLEKVVPIPDKDCNVDSHVPVALLVQLDQVEKAPPADCGLCNPEDWLLGNRLWWFHHQERSLLPLQPCVSDLPRACIRVELEAETKLCDLLLKMCFSTLLPESHIATREDGRPLLGGLCMVEDRPGKHRLIFDQRPTSLGGGSS